MHAASEVQKRIPWNVPQEAELNKVQRPVVARATTYPPGAVAPHSHHRSQLAFAAAGTIKVTTAQGIWIIPPWRAAWIPTQTVHSIESQTDVLMRSVYVDPAFDMGLKSCCVVGVTPLLRELILHAVNLPKDYAPGSPDEHVMVVLLEQLKASNTSSFCLPMPRDRRLLKIARALLDNPADARGLKEWAQEVGAGTRTLSRLFPAETGMQFRAWQQQVRLLEALRLLAAGNPVTNVAYDVGYDSPSAFVSMFKRALGRTPGQYFEQ
jgi:AraC-like DNA-binding protein/quercetin dioxygenase-like cupin family protein